MNIVTDTHELSFRCEEVIDLRKEGLAVQDIILKLKKEVRERKLPGLAANQLGFDKRVIVVAFGDDVRTFINPIISSAEGLAPFIDTCPSIPDRRFIRLRNSKISVTYLTPLGRVETAKDLMGKAADVFQELIDHLEGVLLSDIGLEIDDDFDKATPEEREELLKAYCDAMDVQLDKLNKEIEESPELSKIADATKFIKGVQDGSVKLYRKTEKESK